MPRLQNVFSELCFLVVIAGLLCGPAARNAAATRFEHPGAAYSVEPPTEWYKRASVNPQGFPFHIFTPDKETDVNMIDTGLWIYAIPIPTDQSLEVTNLGVIIAQVLSSDEPGLEATPSAQAATNLGTLEATQFNVKGTRRESGAWRGRMLVALQQDSFLVVMYGSPPKRWGKIKPIAEASLTSFVAPLRLPPIDEPPLPDNTQRLRDVSDRLTAATPMIHAKARRRDDPNTWSTIWTGSGFVIRGDGYVVTNRHVVDAGSNRSHLREAFDPVVLSWDRSLQRENVVADVVSISHKDDLALLKIRGNNRWPAVALADVTNVRTGDRIVTVGWPAPSQFGRTAISQNEGSLTTIERDGLGRPTKLRHSARTTGGNSGGPVYDLDVGAVIGAHYQGLISQAKSFPEVLYHGAVPVQRILWDFPQIAANHSSAHGLPPEDRLALIAYYFLQERFGAAMFECRLALDHDVDNGVASAYIYRISLLQGAPTQAKRYLYIALKDPSARPLASAFAGRTALEVDDYVQALEWGKRTADLRPNDPEGHLVQGHALLGMGRFVQAQASFEKAHQIGNQLHPEAISMVGAAPLLKWLSDNNVTAFPTQVRPTAMVIGNARRNFERSLAIWPARNWPPHLFLGVVAAIDGNERTAIRHRNDAYRLVGSDADGLLSVAWFDLMYGEYGAALSSIKEAQRIRATARGHFFNGWALLMHSQRLAKAGKGPKALEAAKVASSHYRFALKLSPAAAWAPAVKGIVAQLPPP